MNNNEKIKEIEKIVLGKQISTGDRLQLFFKGYATEVDEAQTVIKVSLVDED